MESLKRFIQETGSKNEMKKYLYEIKKESFINIGEADLIDNFIDHKLNKKRRKFGIKR